MAEEQQIPEWREQYYRRIESFAGGRYEGLESDLDSYANYAKHMMPNIDEQRAYDLGSGWLQEELRYRNSMEPGNSQSEEEAEKFTQVQADYGNSF